GAHRPRLPLALRRPVRRTGRPRPTGRRPGLRSPTVRLDTPTALGVQRGVMGLRHADRVAPCRHTWGDPCACGRGLDEEADLRTCGKHRCAPLSWRRDTLLQHLTGCGAGTNLAWLFMDLDANLFQGWAPVDAAWTAFIPWGDLCYPVRMTSRFISSIRRLVNLYARMVWCIMAGIRTAGRWHGRRGRCAQIPVESNHHAQDCLIRKHRAGARPL